MNMGKMYVVGAGLLLGMPLAVLGAVKDMAWCTVEMPERVEIGEAYKVKVTPKKSLPGDCQIAVHMHYKKKDGQWGGFYDYAPPQPWKVGETAKFAFKAKADKPARTFYPLIFVAPKGEYSKKLKDFDIDVGGIACGKDGESERGYPQKPESIKFKKSHMWLEEPPAPARVGDKVTLKIRYRLDASETWGDKPTEMMCMPIGPWIDNPDGVVNKERRHVGYDGMGVKFARLEPGEHVVEFSWTLKEAFRYNKCAFLCQFKRPDGKLWPWSWRAPSMTICRPAEPFALEPTALGGLFKYGETPTFKLAWGAKTAPGARKGVLVVKNIAGREVLKRSVEVDPAKKTETLKLDGLSERGTFSVALWVEDVGDDTCYFGTIPVFRREKGRATPFGATDLDDEDFAKVAADLGFTYVRLFKNWNYLQPAPDVFYFGELDRQVDACVKNGLRPWPCLFDPPPWTLPGDMTHAGYEPSPFDLKAWSGFIDKLVRRYRGRLYGIELLNEIVPGSKCKDPVKEYVEICRVGSQSAKAADPNILVQMAGGLWPRGYRLDLLNAGIGRWIDILPVHYSSYEGILEAKGDLAQRGFDRVKVIDNETSNGMSTWNMDPAMALGKSVEQCRHVMTRWPDELCAGAHFVTMFGGWSDPAGNWSYLYDRRSPRPMAVTLGVVQSKLGYAQPVGKFFMEGCCIHLFSLNGKALAFVRAADREGVKLRMPAKGPLTVTDYQGNETRAADGVVTAGDMPVIVEGLDLDAMRLYAALRVGASDRPAAEPQVVVDASERMPVPVVVSNPYGGARVFSLRPAGTEWGRGESVEVRLGAGESKALTLVYVPNGGAKVPAVSRVSVEIATSGVPAVSRPFLLYAIDQSAIGNLMVNGDLEDGTRGWSGSREVGDAPDGTGKALVFKGTGKGHWKFTSQDVTPPVPGQSYLYTCWIWGDGQGGGSTVREDFTDGKPSKTSWAPGVFVMGDKGSKGWHYMAKRVNTHENTRRLNLNPVVDGSGVTYMDNFCFSFYRGSDFAAFAGRSGGKARASAVPLLCENQVKVEGGYAWSPANLAGIAYFTWDEEALKLTCTVTDDVSAPNPVGATGEEVLAGDALALSIFPKCDAEGCPVGDQLRWYMSLARPGGGSGATTLYRPRKYAMGLKSGQLAKDSSVYQVDFRRDGGKTVYEVRIPWSEIPGFTPARGATFGCNLTLFDVDGGSGRGRMVWGVELSDTAVGCGVVTLLP